MKVKRQWALMSLCMALFGAILNGCSQSAEEKYTEEVGHDHKKGEPHQHQPGDKH